MTEWGLIAAFGIPAALIVGAIFGMTWERLNHEEYED